MKEYTRKNQPENKKIYIRSDGTKAVETIPLGLTMTQQQHQEECDVNNIVAKYKKTGTITHVRNAQEGVYADLTNLPDLQQAQHALIQATQAFEEVPSQIRTRFGNDPALFVKFLSDEKNDEEAIKLGLKVRPPTITPDPILSELQTLNKNLSTKPKTKLTT